MKKEIPLFPFLRDYTPEEGCRMDLLKHCENIIKKHRGIQLSKLIFEYYRLFLNRQYML